MERQERDLHEGWLGYILLSLLSDRGISRQVLPVRIFHGNNHRKMGAKYEGIRLAFKTWSSNRTRLRKILLASEDFPLEKIVMKVNELFDGNIIAVQLQIGRRNELWTNPIVAEIFSRMAEARACASQADGNDSAKRFWKKLEILYQSDVGLPFETLENELRHFQKKFAMSL